LRTTPPTSKAGEVYAIENPAWPGWIKIGQARNALRRLATYQTGSPHRDYRILYRLKVANADAVEATAHRVLGEIVPTKNEWFKARHDQARGAIDTAAQLISGGP
jgi:hypothetical protein